MQNNKWNFDNSYVKLPKLFYTKQLPVPVKEPKPVVFNSSLAEYLGVPLQTEVFAGNIIPEDAEPLAQAYAGHQFGYFTMLGDGRALLLGEHITSSGERFDIQLKGSGRTPYSRSGDGRAAIGPMLREYIISEAMFALGIPTTRSLAVVETGETVIRDKKIPGAILTRVAASHIRVGTFEFASQLGEKELRRLADYTVMRHFKSLEKSENKYRLLLKEVIKRQAELISAWQSVGFIHGVMNTDNMAISGETIDYGPCAFMDIYHPSTVFSSIDTNGRYAYENQPKIAAWNLARFAEALLPLLHDDESEAVKIAQEEINKFFNLFENYWLSKMRAKLGLFNKEFDDEILIKQLLQLMQENKADFTNTFRSLTLGKTDNTDAALFSTADFHDWNERWQMRLFRQTEPKSEVEKLMKTNNPSVIPRNHRVEESLAAAENGDLSVMAKLLEVLKNPYAYALEQEEYSIPNTASCGYQTFCGT